MCGIPCKYTWEHYIIDDRALVATEATALRKSAKLFNPLWQPCVVIVMGAIDWRCVVFGRRLASVADVGVFGLFIDRKNGTLWDDNFAFFLEIMFNILNRMQIQLHKCLNTQQSMRMRKNRRFIRRVDDAYSI